MHFFGDFLSGKPLMRRFIKHKWGQRTFILFVCWDMKETKYRCMEWEEKLKSCFRVLKGCHYEDIYRMCLDAYIEGRMEERRNALEAHRLRCCKLFGNRCMDFHLFGKSKSGVCDGECLYLKRFEMELYRLDG